MSSDGSMAMLLVIPILVLVWLLPAILIARSNKTSGTEKLLWILVQVFLFWFTWVVYIFAAPINKEKPQS
ncbi:hypothetical protein [Pseudoalteromonas sp. GB56]